MNHIAWPVFIGFLCFLFGIRFFLRKKQKKENTLTVFPEAWRKILLEGVEYYHRLSQEDQKLFEKRILNFLNTKKITGVEVSVDDEIKVLVAASAIIPAFAFADYNYPMIREVLLYNTSFDNSFLHPNREVKQDHILGMVGNGPLSQVVLLSKPDVMAGFKGTDKHQNVGIHEFTHLLDKTDGSVDGIPATLLDKQFIQPWINEMHQEVKRIYEGSSDISPYALTNEAEFLAVASEYFFNSPEEFKQGHPELLAHLQKIFHQNPSNPSSKGLSS